MARFDQSPIRIFLALQRKALHELGNNAGGKESNKQRKIKKDEPEIQFCLPLPQPLAYQEQRSAMSADTAQGTSMCNH